MDLRTELFLQYGPGEDHLPALPEIHTEPSPDTIRTLFGCLDLTFLNTQDNQDTARHIIERLNEFPGQFPGMPPVAAVCVYPLLVGGIRQGLASPGVRIASVGAGFPASQTFLAVKLAECGLLVSKGVDEIDVVMPVGAFLAGEYMAVLDELLLIRDVCKGVTLKVILETGLLGSAEAIRLASLIAMEAGADFIKTSTGKTAVSATPEAVQVMALAVRDYHSVSGRAVGIKPAGGISEVRDACLYHDIVSEILGSGWTVPGRFRIGASRLANRLLSAATNSEITWF